MGAIFLYRSDTRVCVQDAKQVFDRKGFSNPTSFLLNDWQLLLYSKIGTPVRNYFAAEGRQIFACGTLVYKSLGYVESLKQLLNDQSIDAVDQDALRGQFLVLFFDGRKTQLLADRRNSLHLFANESRTTISSSFLAALAASPHPMPLDRRAVCEKISTGYIIGPDTLVKGISQVDDDIAREFSVANNSLSFLSRPPQHPPSVHNSGRRESLNRQLELLEEHFSAFNDLHLEFSGDLGLSDGYDSRLLYACSRFLTRPLTLHTHATKGVHEKSRQIAERLALETNQRLNSVKTQRIVDCTDERIAEVIRDGVFLFDGRNANSIGVAGETQTRDYKLASLGHSRLSFNGLGGEMYRNYYNTRRWGTFSSNAWMSCHDVFPFAREIVGDDTLFNDMLSHRNKKIHTRLGSDESEDVDILWTRRFYSEIRTLECDGNNGDAMNQLMFYHSPFCDPKLTREAMAATPYIGLGGSYQTDLINALSPELGAIPIASSRPQVHRMGWKTKARLLAIEHCPLNQLGDRRRRKILSIQNASSASSGPSVLDRQPFNDSLTALLDSFAIRSTEYLSYHYAQGPNAIFLGSFLREFEGKIEWN